MLRPALLHLAPSLGDLEANRRLLENSTRIAGDLGADWVLSGELVVSEYEFEGLIGTAWIESQPDEWLKKYVFPSAMRTTRAGRADPRAGLCSQRERAS
jgi:predicted amidohydrolase